MTSVLIAYWSKTGSTRETAETIGTILEGEGCTVTVKQIDGNLSPENFDACIIGGPINGMQWVPDAARFVDTWSNTLSKKKTVLFCLSYIFLTGGSFWKSTIAKTLRPYADKIGALETAIFGGRLSEPLPAPMRLIFGIKKTSPLNLVNPASITAWAKELAPRLMQTSEL